MTEDFLVCTVKNAIDMYFENFLLMPFTALPDRISSACRHLVCQIVLLQSTTFGKTEAHLVENKNLIDSNDRFGIKMFLHISCHIETQMPHLQQENMKELPVFVKEKIHSQSFESTSKTEFPSARHTKIERSHSILRTIFISFNLPCDAINRTKMCRPTAPTAMELLPSALRRDS